MATGIVQAISNVLKWGGVISNAVTSVLKDFMICEIYD